MKTILCVLISVLGLGAAQAQTSFTVFLSGDQEVPAIETPATGSGMLTLNLDNTLSYSISYSGLVGDYTVSHIHGPSAFGEPGVGVLAPTSDFTLANTPDNGSPTAGMLSGTTGALNEEQLGWLFDELLYVNIHSSFAGGGEIRGQIVPEPSTLALAGMGGALLLAGFFRRRRGNA